MVTRAGSAVRMPTPHDKRTLYVTLVLMAVSLFPLIFSSGLRLLTFLIPLGYMLNGSLRHNRPWSEVGIKRGFRNDFRQTWYLFGTVAILLQIGLPVLFLAFWPDMLQHIEARLPSVGGSLAGTSAVVGLIALIIPLALMEEVVFRVVFQERLGWFTGVPTAIIVVSVIFGLAHWSAGSLPLVVADVALVTLDGAFYGVIYAKTHNLLLSWMAHSAADIIGLLALLVV